MSIGVRSENIIRNLTKRVNTIFDFNKPKGINMPSKKTSSTLKCPECGETLVYKDGKVIVCWTCGKVEW